MPVNRVIFGVSANFKIIGLKTFRKSGYRLYFEYG